MSDGQEMMSLMSICLTRIQAFHCKIVLIQESPSRGVQEKESIMSMRDRQTDRQTDRSVPAASV